MNSLDNSSEQNKVQNQACCQKKYRIFFFQFLANTFINVILSYPQGLQSDLLQSPYNFSNFQYGLFYGISSLPNIILPLFAGIYLDKYGYSIYLIIFLETSFLLGSLTVVLGSYFVSYNAMVIGQMLLGVGSSNIQLLIKRFVLKISSQEESVNLWGLLLVSVRIGTLISSFLPALIFDLSGSIPLCFLVVSAICLSICICFNLSLWLSKNYDIEKNEDLEGQNPLLGDQSLLSHIKQFFSQASLMFWLAILLVFSNFMMICGWISEANDFLIGAVNISALEASYFLIYYSVLSGVAQVTEGYLFSKYGYYIYAMIFGAINQLIACILFIGFFGTASPYLMLIPITLMSIGYTLGATFIFSCIGFIVEKKFLGVAYGMLQCGVEFGNFFGSILYGLIKDWSTNVLQGYFWPTIELIAFIALNLGTAIVMLIIDARSLKVLGKNKKIQ